MTPPTLSALSASDWEVLAPLIITTFFLSLTNMIVALRGHSTGKEALEQGAETLRQVSPPSNGHTLGELAESVVNASTAAAIESARVRKELRPNLPAPSPVIPDAVHAVTEILPPPPLPDLGPPPITPIPPVTPTGGPGAV